MEQSDLDFTVNLADVEGGAGSKDNTQVIPGKTEEPTKTQLSETTASGYSQSNQKKTVSACSILTVDYWSEYFDVTQEEIVAKIKAAINPTSLQFNELISNKVDLYGPFWISTTLIFCMIIMPRFYQALFFREVNFDISKVGFGFSLVYGGGAAFTLIYYLLAKFMGAECELFKTAAIYGYSYTVFIVASLATVLSVSFMHFIFAMAAGIHSVLFLIKNFQPVLEKLEKQNKLAMIAFFGIFQLLMTLLIYGNYLS